jgi:hypothetical protein
MYFNGKEGENLVFKKCSLCSPTTSSYGKNSWKHLEKKNQEKMFRRRFLILLGILVLLMAVVPQVFAQTAQDDDLFQNILGLADRNPNSTDLLPVLLNYVFAQGIVPVMPGNLGDPNTAPDPAVAEAALGVFMEQANELIRVAKKIADADNPPEVSKAALRVLLFVEYYKNLVDMTAQKLIPLEDPANDPAQQVVQPVPIIIRQFVNPLFITYWRPWPDHPREIEEKVFTAEIPIWGAAVIVKEVRGVKLELVRGPLPINPCWWWRLYRIPWHWWWYYYRLVPAEFVKTISYVNTWNREKGMPEVIKKVEQDVIIDSELMKFWWFLSDPQAAPENTEGNPNMGSSQIKKEAVVWGNLKRSR